MKQFLDTYKTRITLVLFLALLVNIITIRIFDAPLKNEVCKHGISSFELAKEINNTKAILASWDENAKINMSLSLGFDFLFLLVYSSFIALLIYNTNERIWAKKPFYFLGKILVFTTFLAAIFDVVENIALVKILLDDVRQLWATIAYYFASMKFGLLLISISYLLINWFILTFKKWGK